MNKQTNELKKRCAAKTSDNDKTKKDTIIPTCINLQLELSVTEAHTLNEEKLRLKDCLLLNPFSRSYFLEKSCLIVCLKFGTLDLCKLIFRSQICTQTIHFSQGKVLGFVELYSLVCFLLCHGLLRNRKVKEMRKNH